MQPKKPLGVSKLILVKCTEFWFTASCTIDTEGRDRKKQAIFKRWKSWTGFIHAIFMFVPVTSHQNASGVKERLFHSRRMYRRQTTISGNIEEEMNYFETGKKWKRKLEILICDKVRMSSRTLFLRNLWLYLEKTVCFCYHKCSLTFLQLSFAISSHI